MFDIFNMLKKEENAAPKQITRDTIIGDILDMGYTFQCTFKSAVT